MSRPSFVTLQPLGSVVFVGFSLLNQTMKGNVICRFGTPISTTANVFAVSRRNVTDVPHHSRDTEGYTATTSTDPTIGMMMTWLHCAAVIVHESSSFFSTVTEPSF